MNKLKRIIVSTLASLMLLANVSHANDLDLLPYRHEIAIKKVMLTEVMNGTSEGFSPHKNLTRAEAAAIMTRVSGISKDECDSRKGKTIFSDVLEGGWSSGYITVASEKGFINGDGKGKFSPSQNVTVAQFKTMAIRALGAGSYVDSLGKWPNNYIDFATKHKIGLEVKAKDNENITRADAALILEDIFAKDMWNGNMPIAGKNILNTYMGISEVHANFGMQINLEDDLASYSYITYDGTEVDAYDKFVGGIEISSMEDHDIWRRKIDDSDEYEIILLKDGDAGKYINGYFSEIKGSDLYKDLNLDKKVTVKKDYDEYTFPYVEDSIFSIYDPDFKDGSSRSIFSINHDGKYHGNIFCKDGVISHISVYEYDEIRKVKSIKDEGDYLYIELNVKGDFIRTLKDYATSKLKVGDNIYVSSLENGDMLIRCEYDPNENGELRCITKANIAGKTFDDSSLITITASDVVSDLKVSDELPVDDYNWLENCQTVNHAINSSIQKSRTGEGWIINIRYEAERGYAFGDEEFEFQDIKGAMPEVDKLSPIEINLKYFVEEILD